VLGNHVDSFHDGSSFCCINGLNLSGFSLVISSDYLYGISSFDVQLGLLIELSFHD